MSSQKWRIYENRLVRERRNEEHCNAIKGMLKEQSRQATYSECNVRVEAMRRQRAEALERQERLAGERFLKAEQEKENQKQITEFQERVATQLATKKAHEARQEALRRRVVDGSDELRVLKEKLHAAQVNKVWAKQLLEKQERDASEMQKEAVMAAQLEDLRIQSEQKDEREMQQKALRMKALQKDNQELLARKNQSDEAMRQFEHDKRLVEEVMAKVQDEDRRELALREERKKSAMEMLMQHREEQDRRRREDELRQAQEEEDIEAYARQKRAWEERLAREKSEQDASRWRLQQEMLRQQNQRHREAQEVERLREDLWREEKEEEDRRKELLKARKILEDKQEMLQAYQEHLEREEIRRKREIAQEQEERQQLMARYEEDNRLNQLSDQKRRIKMQEYRRAVDHQMEERRQLYEAERQKERDELARMKAEEAEQARIVEEERQSLLRMFAQDARHFPKGALVKAADFEAVGLPKPFQPEARPMQRNNLGLPPYPVRQRSAPTPAFQPPARR